MASVISATVLTSGIGVSAADFSDSAVETSVSEDETPVAEESEEFSSDAAEAASAIAVNTRRAFIILQVEKHFWYPQQKM